MKILGHLKQLYLQNNCGAITCKQMGNIEIALVVQYNTKS